MTTQTGMHSFWDSRYNTDQFVYGKEPNRFFASELDKLPAGRLLLPGEGEGRNAVYAAKMGWEVDAFDQSRIGSEKALGFALEQGVHINYQVCDLEGFTFKRHYYDAVCLIYFHASPPVRKLLHSRVINSLRPGGIVILEGFHKSQLGRSTGGPQAPEMLFDRISLLEDFGELVTLRLEELQVTLDEGSFHQGEASVICYAGRKKI